MARVRGWIPRCQEAEARTLERHDRGQTNAFHGRARSNCLVTRIVTRDTGSWWCSSHLHSTSECNVATRRLTLAVSSLFALPSLGLTCGSRFHTLISRCRERGIGGGVKGRRKAICNLRHREYPATLQPCIQWTCTIQLPRHADDARRRETTVLGGTTCVRLA